MFDPELVALAIHFEEQARAAQKPLVLALTRVLDEPSQATLEGMRKELRALGAALVVLSERSLFCFRGDDDTEVHAPKLALERAQAPDSNHEFGRIGELAAALQGGHVTLRLLDSSGAERFLASLAATERVSERLLSVLRLAARDLMPKPTALPARQPFGACLTRREAVVLSLMGAFALLAEAGCKQKAHPPTPPVAPAAPREVQIGEDRAHSDAEVREHMSGNICRCGAYVNIVQAIQLGRRASSPT